MKIRITLLSLVWLICLVLSPEAISQNFYQKNGEIYDLWDICRTRPQGFDGYFQVTEKGFRPVIAFESLGSNADIAYRLGQEFLRQYPDSYQRAERIYTFVRDRVRYTQDLSQFGYPEFAQNADELAKKIQEGGAQGDCEDYAVLLATMYKAAGYRTAIVLVPGHAAALVHLPGYQKANISLTFNEESGWIWAEATGRNNPLGWYPQRALQSKAYAYELEEIEDLTLRAEPAGKIAQVKGKSRSLSFSPFFFLLLIMWILPMISRIFMITAARKKF